MMNVRIGLATIGLLALATVGRVGYAAAAPGGLVAGDASATFAFTTSVKTPKGTKSGSGTIRIKRSGERELLLTIESGDGKPARSVPLIVGVDGSVAPDPSAAGAGPTDPTEKTQAAAFMAAMTIAAHVGIGARKNGGAASYSVPVKLTPVGNGTPVSTQLAMNGAGAQYTGVTQGSTLTELPPGGGLDPSEIAKTVGVTAFAHHAFGPAGRVATAAAMHRKRKEEKEATTGMLADDIRLTVTTDLSAGKVQAIRGNQIDGITIGGKLTQIESSWTFTRVPS